MKRLPLLLILPALVALAGCQTIKAHNPFRNKQPEYKSAQQEAPLEVPPGMDQPPTSEALTIPQAGTGATATAAPQQSPTAPPGLQSAPAAAAATGSSSLVLADTPDSAWHRVGLALQRGGIGEVTAQDQSARTYQVSVSTVVTEKSEGGFFHRLFHRDKSQTVTGTVGISVSPQGDHSVVEASGDADAATRVIALLKQRLK